MRGLDGLQPALNQVHLVFLLGRSLVQLFIQAVDYGLQGGFRISKFRELVFLGLVRLGKGHCCL